VFLDMKNSSASEENMAFTNYSRSCDNMVTVFLLRLAVEYLFSFVYYERSVGVVNLWEQA
jgi:hypothetical protein